MMRHYFLLIVVFSLVVGCTIVNKEPSQPFKNILPYTESFEPYNESLCGDFTGSQERSQTGLRIAIIDKDTGQTILGDGTFNIPSQFSGGIPVVQYSCFSVGAPTTMAIQVVASSQAPGYAPVRFNYTISPNRMVTLTVPLVLSNKEDTVDFATYEEQSRFIKILTDRGIKESSYTLTDAEYDFSRGGFIKARAKTSSGVPFIYFYHWGWCSSGGTDCGFSVCFSTPNKAFFDKNHDAMCTDGRYSPLTECEQGIYDYYVNGSYMVSYFFEANRENSEVRKGLPVCD